MLTDSIDDQINVSIMKCLTFEPESLVLQFKTVYEQGIRNFMLTYSWITYILLVSLLYFPLYGSYFY